MAPNSRRALIALTAIGDGGNVTQRSLAGRLQVSLGLANALLRDLETQRMIAIKRRAMGQSAQYALTKTGRKAILRLAAGLAVESGEQLRPVRDALAQESMRLAGRGVRRVLLCGSGVLADIAASALQNAGIRVAAVAAPGDEQDRVAGLRSRPLASLSKLSVDAAVALSNEDGRLLRKHLKKGTRVVSLLPAAARKETDRA